MPQFSTFTLSRLSDDLVYTFDRAEHPGGSVGYKRRDRDLWILYQPQLGWVAYDDNRNELQGRPWNVQPAEQESTHPPEGEWVSKKGAKSYVYMLKYISEAK